MTERLHFHALEKEMATHSSVLAWRIQGQWGASWAAVSGVAEADATEVTAAAAAAAVLWPPDAPLTGPRPPLTCGAYKASRPKACILEASCSWRRTWSSGSQGTRLSNRVILRGHVSLTGWF